MPLYALHLLTTGGDMGAVRIDEVLGLLNGGDFSGTRERVCGDVHLSDRNPERPHWAFYVWLLRDQFTAVRTCCTRGGKVPVSLKRGEVEQV